MDNKTMDLGNLWPVQAAGEYGTETEVTLTFLADYNALEQALVRTGFKQASPTPGSAQADWIAFARHIEGKFHSDTSEVLQGAVAYLLGNEKNMDLRLKRLEVSNFWDVTSPHRDIIWIAELLQLTRHRLAHGLNFPGQPGCELAQILAAMYVVEAWSHIDPRVESMLKDLQ